MSDETDFDDERDSYRNGLVLLLLGWVGVMMLIGGVVLFITTYR